MNKSLVFLICLQFVTNGLLASNFVSDEIDIEEDVYTVADDLSNLFNESYEELLRQEIERALELEKANDKIQALNIHYYAGLRDGNFQLVKRINALPSCVCAQNKVGKTPLHIAVKNDMRMNVIHLLLAGADYREILDRNGKTPWEYCSETADGEWLNLLFHALEEERALRYNRNENYEIAVILKSILQGNVGNLDKWLKVWVLGKKAKQTKASRSIV